MKWSKYFFGCKTSVIRSHAKSLFLDVERMLNNHPAPVINNISCDTMEHFTLHIHAHLNIFINGEGYSIPSNVGIIPNQCIYWLHTHDDTGIIHIESPENRILAGQGNNLTVYVNGKQANPGTDFRKIPVNAYDEIVIIYGKPPDSIPSSYKFPEEL